MHTIAVFSAIIAGCFAGLLVVVSLTKLLGIKPTRSHAQVRLNEKASPFYQLAKSVNSVVPLPQTLMMRTRLFLSRAGLDIAPGLWHGASILFYASAALVTVMLISSFSSDAKMRLLLGTCLAAISLPMPRLLLAMLASRRAAKIKAALPLALDLLAVSVEGGLTMSRAITLVCEKSSGPLAEEFKLVMRDIRYLGFTLSQALSAMAERCHIEELTMFVAAVSASLAAGAPVATTLKVQSEVMFNRHCQELEERVNKMPAQMVIPIGLFMLAAVIIAAVAPIAINILASMQVTAA